MATGTVHATSLNDWTVAFDATGHPTTISGDDATVFIGSGGTHGGAYATLGDLDGTVPDGATVTVTHVKLLAEGSGGHVSPLVNFNSSSNPTASHAAWAIVGAGGVGEALDGNTSAHLIDYTTGSIVLDGTALGWYQAAAAGTAVVLVMVQRSLGGNSVSGDYITYLGSSPIEVTWEWDDGEPVTTTVIPPLRQYPRSDGLGASSAPRVYPPPNTIQRGNRRGPSAIL